MPQPFQFQFGCSDFPDGIRENYRTVCSDPQCDDSTWDHACDLGERLGTFSALIRNDVWVPIYLGDWYVADHRGDMHVIPDEFFTHESEATDEA